MEHLSIQKYQYAIKKKEKRKKHLLAYSSKCLCENTSNLQDEASQKEEGNI